MQKSIENINYVKVIQLRKACMRVSVFVICIIIHLLKNSKHMLLT